MTGAMDSGIDFSGMIYEDDGTNYLLIKKSKDSSRYGAIDLDSGFNVVSVKSKYVALSKIRAPMQYYDRIVEYIVDMRDGFHRLYPTEKSELDEH